MPKLKYASLKVIDPDDGVIVTAHTLLPCEEACPGLSHDGSHRRYDQIKSS
jgi:hypothetical protein